MNLNHHEISFYCALFGPHAKINVLALSHVRKPFHGQMFYINNL